MPTVPAHAPEAAGRLASMADVTASDAALRRFLHGLPGVDAVGLESRAAMLGTRSIKTTAKAYAIDLAISVIDLTTLEGADTPGKVRALCAKGVRPDPSDPTTPRVAAICVYPDMVHTAKQALSGTGSPVVRVASVATAFPAGRASLEVKLADTADAVAAGADEVDMVIDRGAFLAGRYLQVFEEIKAVKQVCSRGRAHPRTADPSTSRGGARHSGAKLKVIFENGELSTYDNIRRCSWLAMLAGADFIKTSTGKVTVNATAPNTLLMLEAVRDFRAATGVQVGVKPAGGIRTSKEAITYLVMVNETLGDQWLSSEWFRFGASSLLNDLLMQRQKLRSGRYSGPDYVTVD